VISKENYLKASGFASAASIPALNLAISDQSNPNNQATPVKLGTDVTSVTVEGGGYCGEGRVLGDLVGDIGIYGDTPHNGPRFDELSLSFTACAALCDTYPGCLGFSWKPEQGLHLDGNCVMRGTACTAATVVPATFKFYAKPVPGAPVGGGGPVTGITAA